MKNAVKNFTGWQCAGKNASSARVVDGKLILSCPEALNPVVWQMDLDTAKASALEVREIKNNFVLTLKTMKGETAEIAPFASKSAAVHALMAASRALENAHGKIRPLAIVSSETPATSSIAPAKRGGRWATALLAFLLIVVLIGIWGAMAPRPPMSVENAAGGPAGNTATPKFGGSDEAGVPLSADEFLLKHQR